VGCETGRQVLQHALRVVDEAHRDVRLDLGEPALELDREAERCGDRRGRGGGNAQLRRDDRRRR
jgi:hypothetical protein